MDSKRDLTQSMDEAQIQDLFAQVKTAKIEPSPYMKTRILARLRETQTQKQRLFLWKWLTGGAFVAALFLGVLSVRLYERTHQDGVVRESYVIQVDFNQTDLEKVAKAEVVLPEDVHFVSSKREIRAERRLKLPMTLKSAGRGKLPFVVTSTAPGEKKITVRLLDENNGLVREQVLKFQFAKNNQLAL